MPLVSAHRGGAGGVAAENSIAAIESAIALGCDYVELDVRLTRDGRAVLSHDDDPGVAGAPRSIAAHRLADLQGVGLTTLDDALAAIQGRIGAHVDLKVVDRDLAVTRQVVEAVGVDALVVTSAEDADVRSITRWADAQAPGLRVGLSTAARHPPGRVRPTLTARIASWFPRTRLRRSGANVVAAHHVWARWWLRSWARRRGLPLLVWTVDTDHGLRRWVHDPHTWVVTTNRPARALELRLSSPGSGAGSPSRGPGH